MNIQFVNHASCIFSYQNINLICDPWIEGKVFNEGWSLLVESKLNYKDFDKITHIWFSHEHPDHFSPPNINKIDPIHRAEIVVLYRKTNDKKVINFCKNLGFKDCIELEPRKKYSLNKKFEIMTDSIVNDSWLNIKTDKHSVLNMNDCVFNNNITGEKIKKLIGKVDLLLTQFSYASKIGNSSDYHMRVKSGKNKTKQLINQINVFKPKYTIPFASFCWFSHQENYYMNDAINKVDLIEKVIKNTNSSPIILYPGDNHIMEEDTDNTNSIKKYMSAYDNIKNNKLSISKSTPIKELKQTCKEFSEKIKTDYPFKWIILSMYPIIFL